MKDFKPVIKTVKLSNVVDGKLFVRQDEHLPEMIESIRKVGVLKPPIVTPRTGNTFEVIDGHRRLHACKSLKIPELQVQVVKGNVSTVYSMAAADLLSQGLSVLEQALFFQKWVDELDLSERELAELLHVTPQYISTRKRLLQLDDLVRTMLKKRELDPSHAELLVNFPKSKQRYLAKAIKKKSVREAERYLQPIRNGHLTFDMLRQTAVQVDLPEPALTPEEEERAFEIMKRCAPAIRLLIRDQQVTDVNSTSRSLKLGQREIASLPKSALAAVFRLIQPSGTKCKHCHKMTDVKLDSLDYSIWKDDLLDLEDALRDSTSKIGVYRQRRIVRYGYVPYSQPKLHPLEILSRFLMANPTFNMDSQQWQTIGEESTLYLMRFWRRLFQKKLPKSDEGLTKEEKAWMWAFSIDNLRTLKSIKI